MVNEYPSSWDKELDRAETPVLNRLTKGPALVPEAPIIGWTPMRRGCLLFQRIADVAYPIFVNRRPTVFHENVETDRPRADLCDDSWLRLLALLSVRIPGDDVALHHFRRDKLVVENLSSDWRPCCLHVHGVSSTWLWNQLTDSCSMF